MFWILCSFAPIIPKKYTRKLAAFAAHRSASQNRLLVNGAGKTNACFSVACFSFAPIISYSHFVLDIKLIILYHFLVDRQSVYLYIFNIICRRGEEMNQKAEKNLGWSYVLAAYITFVVMVLGICGCASMVFHASPLVMRILSNLCAWSPTIVLFV